MDSGSGASSAQKKGKGTSVPRRAWSKKEEEVLIEALKKLCAEGWKLPNATFKQGYTARLETSLMNAFPGTDLRASPHIDSRIKTWKRQYNTISSMMSTSGFGFNDRDKTIEVDSDDIWEAYLKKDSNAKNMRNKPFPYYNDWQLFFGKDRATGEFAESPIDAVEGLDKEECEIDDEVPISNPGLEDLDCSVSVTQSVTKKGKKVSKKRSRGDDACAQEINDMTKVIETFCNETRNAMSVLAQRVGYERDISIARREVNGVLTSLPLDLSERLVAASMITSDAQKVDLFFSLLDEERLQYVLLLLGRNI